MLLKKRGYVLLVLILSAMEYRMEDMRMKRLIVIEITVNFPFCETDGRINIKQHHTKAAYVSILSSVCLVMTGKSK